jgi:hypothetical protein
MEDMTPKTLEEIKAQIEEAKGFNYPRTIVPRITDQRILFELKNEGYAIDTSGKTITIISWR